MADSDPRVKQVFDLLTDDLIRDLKDPERSTPGVYQAALRFLKENGIQQLPVPGSKTDEVLKTLKFQRGTGT